MLSNIKFFQYLIEIFSIIILNKEKNYDQKFRKWSEYGKLILNGLRTIQTNRQCGR